VHGAQLVAIRVEHIGEVECPHRPDARPGRIFDRLAAGRNRGIMECLDLFKAVAGKADGRTIGCAGGLIIDRFTDRKIPPLCMKNRRLCPVAAAFSIGAPAPNVPRTAV